MVSDRAANLHLILEQDQRDWPFGKDGRAVCHQRVEAWKMYDTRILGQVGCKLR